MSTACTDTSTLVDSLVGSINGSIPHLETDVFTLDGAKSYGAFANSWGIYTSQVVNLDGLSFTVSDPAKTVAASAGAPPANPAFMLGSYAGVQSLGSNLPKLASLLTTIPTIISANVASRDTSNYAVVCTLLFTPTGDTLSPYTTAIDPGAIFLEIWLYMPANQRPGTRVLQAAHPVAGVDGTWDVWDSSSTGAASAVTYVSTAPLSELTFDANRFVQDAVKNKFRVKSTMYLNVAFGGIRIWADGDGLRLKQFCLQVN